ncbi:MAG: hypothetical protein Q8P31_12930, partial [Bacillota bacterium]|nr:hypothetical protein [Bacillota bacterium]
MLGFLASAYTPEVPGPGIHPGAGTASSWWLLVLALPFLGALALSFFRRMTSLSDGRRPDRLAARYGAWTALACVASFGLLLRLWLGGAPQGTISLHGLVGLGLSFEVTPLGLLFALFASFLWMMAALFSLTYLASSHAQGRYYFYFLLCLAG